MNATVELGGVVTRPKHAHLISISRKANERSRSTPIPADIMVRKPRTRKPVPVLPVGSYAAPVKPDQATMRSHHTFDRAPYATGDGDISYALRPGAMDFMKHKSFGHST